MDADSKWNELVNRLYAREVLIREMADAMEYYASRGGGRCKEILSRPGVKAIIGAGPLETRRPEGEANAR